LKLINHLSFKENNLGTYIAATLLRYFQ
jgi:hypothetical protein